MIEAHFNVKEKAKEAYAPARLPETRSHRLSEREGAVQEVKRLQAALDAKTTEVASLRKEHSLQMMSAEQRFQARDPIRSRDCSELTLAHSAQDQPSKSNCSRCLSKRTTTTSSIRCGASCSLRKYAMTMNVEKLTRF